MKRLLPILLFLSVPAFANTIFYVRADGGTRYDATTNPTGQCDGKHDAAYPGSGINQPCGYNDVRWLYDNLTYGAYNWALSGGDWAIIDPGAWQIGFDSPTTSMWCPGQSGATHCVMPGPPSGSPGSPTRILGRNYANCSTTVTEYNGVTGKPYQITQPDPAKTTELYGDYDLIAIADISEVHDIEFGCLEFDAHNSTHCITHGTTLTGGQPPETPACPNSPPYAHNVNRAFKEDANTYNILWHNVYMHGFDADAIRGEFGAGMQMSSFRIAYINGPGFNMSNLDGGHPNGPNASLTMSDGLFEWNGFVQEYPMVDAVPVIIGFSQSTQSTDADAISSQAGASFNFTGTHLLCRYVTEDCYDLGHIENPGDNKSISLSQTLAYGMMGGAYKWGQGATSVYAANTYFDNNCYRMHTSFSGAPSTYNKYLADWCRGNNFISGYLQSTSQLNFFGNTWLSYINTTFDWECGGSPCAGATATLTGNIIGGISNQNCISDGIGTCDYGGNGKPGAFFTVGDGITINHTYNTWYNMRNIGTLGTGEVLANPLLTGAVDYTGFTNESSLDALDFSITNSSPALHSGTPTSLTTDLFGGTRPNPPSMGAVDTGSTPSGGTTVNSGIFINVTIN